MKNLTSIISVYACFGGFILWLCGVLYSIKNRVCKINCVNSLVNRLKLKQGEDANEFFYRRTN